MRNQGRGHGGHFGSGPPAAVLSLPSGISPGEIIGPSGDNIKWVKRETGVRFVNVTDDGISLGGGPAQVAAARRLLDGQMRAMQEAGERGILESVIRT